MSKPASDKIYARIALTEDELQSLRSVAADKPYEVERKLHDACRREVPDAREIAFYEEAKEHWLTLVAKLDKPLLDDKSQDAEEEEDEDEDSEEDE